MFLDVVSSFVFCLHGKKPLCWQARCGGERGLVLFIHVSSMQVLSVVMIYWNLSWACSHLVEVISGFCIIVVILDGWLIGTQ